MSDSRAPVRSYQRIFCPDRRIYQIDGRPLPIPGGVPLAWVGHATATLLIVLLLASRSWPLAALAATAGGFAGWRAAGYTAAVAAGLVALATTQLLGVLLGVLDWPLRLLVLPALIATLATQATPDGRPGRRYLFSWLSLQLRPDRTSLGRRLPDPAVAQLVQTCVPVACDERQPLVRRGRVTGPARVRFGLSLLLDTPRRRNRVRAVVPSPSMPRRLERAPLRDGLELGEGERLELCP